MSKIKKLKVWKELENCSHLNPLEKTAFLKGGICFKKRKRKKKVVSPKLMKVETQGHPKNLYVRSFYAECGGLNGVAFEFENEGGWIISLESLKEIVRQAEKEQEAQED